MSIQIKFRVWNKEQMVSPDYIDRNGVGHWKENSIPEMSDNVMQFTGMKDINGEELYEDDIIEKDDGRGGRIIRIIKFKNGSYRLFKTKGSRASSDNILFAQKIYKSNLIRIGNIHQNPNLLYSKTS